MSQTASQVGPSETENLDSDEVIDILSNRRRRYAIHYLKRQDGRPVTLGELSEQVAGWECEKPTDQLSYRERKRVQNALRQFHLPKMEEHGFVDFDERDGTVTLTKAADRQDFYVDVLWNREVPWGLYYLGISAIGLACLGGLWLNAWPISAIPATAWLVFFVTSVAVSSIAHFYDNYYRMRLGAREVPREVEES